MPLKIDLFMVQSVTERNKHYAAQMLRHAKGYEQDSRVSERHIKRECAYCFYFRSDRLAGQAFTPWECGLCDVPQPMWSNTSIPRVCDKCSAFYYLCVRCGGDLEMESRVSLDPDSYE